MKRPDTVADSVIALETRIAAAHWKREDTSDPSRMYNPMTVSALAASAPGYDWPAFFRKAGLASVSSVTVTQPSAVSATAALYAQLPLADWKQYYRLRLLDAFAPVLLGRLPRSALRLPWQGARRRHRARAALAAKHRLAQRRDGRRHRPAVRAAPLLPAAQGPRADHGHGHSGGVPRIDPVDRMDVIARRAQALDKLSKYGAKIGYPEQWRDYGALLVREHDAVGNRARGTRFAWTVQAARADLQGRPARMAIHAANRGRHVRPDAQRDRVPRSQPAGALLRHQPGRRGQLRRHRREHRARNQPWLR
ncbi:hypothetical protein LP419_29735 [Massilia sp. H-1]|nr:hypothetical protein LP419_29735 [Massilia sp. H-1]